LGRTPARRSEKKLYFYGWCNGKKSFDSITRLLRAQSLKFVLESTNPILTVEVPSDSLSEGFHDLLALWARGGTLQSPRPEESDPMTSLEQLTTLRYAQTGAVATLTLDRPAVLNALDRVMFDELEQAFGALAGEPSVRVVVITGAGDRAFAAGADIRALTETDAASGRAVSERGQQVFSLIETQLGRAGKPVIAAVNGVALGGGCELALTCTFRMASDKARLGLPEVKLGLIPGYGGTQRLTRLIGRGAALRLMLSGMIVDAAEALRLGLVEEVVPASDLLARAQSLAETIAGMSPLALGGVLEAVGRGEEKTLAGGLRDEADIFGRLCGTADKHEGLTAFLEKRAAVWQNR
jgi:enoyl-CoA hydratase